MNELVFLTLLGLLMFISFAVFIHKPKEYLTTVCVGVNPKLIEVHYKKWLLMRLDRNVDPNMWKLSALLIHVVMFLTYGLVVYELETINVFQYLVLLTSTLLLVLVYARSSKAKTTATYLISAVGCICFTASFF